MPRLRSGTHESLSGRARRRGGEIAQLRARLVDSSQFHSLGATLIDLASLGYVITPVSPLARARARLGATATWFLRVHANRAASLRAQD